MLDVSSAEVSIRDSIEFKCKNNNSLKANANDHIMHVFANVVTGECKAKNHLHRDKISKFA